MADLEDEPRKSRGTIQKIPPQASPRVLPVEEEGEVI